MTTSKQDIEELREEFDELFPKDQEAIDGIRPSKSNRSAGLVLNAQWNLILKKALEEQKEEIRKAIENEMKSMGTGIMETEKDIYEIILNLKELK